MRPAGAGDDQAVDLRDRDAVIYGLLADLVVVAHLTFILFVVAGGLLALRWQRSAWIHLPAAVWGVLVELTGWICPLTPLEKGLRLKAGQLGYQGSFVDHHILPLVYPEELTRNVQLVLGALVLVVNAIVYAFVLERRRRISSRRGSLAPRSGLPSRALERTTTRGDSS